MNHLKVDSAPLDPCTGIIYFVASGEGIFHCGSRVQARRGGLAVSNLDSTGQSQIPESQMTHSTDHGSDNPQLTTNIIYIYIIYIYIIYIYLYTHTHTHIYIYNYTHTHIYIYVQTW